MNVSIVIQAGGQSSRMGADKGLVELCGRTMVENIIERLQVFSDEILITSNQPRIYGRFGVRVFPDIFKNYGALAGLHTALSYATNELVFVIACDLPFVNQNLFKYMKNIFEAKTVDVVIPRTDKGFEPFYTFYRKSTCLPLVTEAIECGKKRLISWHENARVHPVYESELRAFDPTLSSFLNINTPEELLVAQEKCIDY